MSNLHPCNYVETGGQFGRRRRLATYAIEPHASNGRFLVWDDCAQPRRLAGSGYASPEAAEAAFKHQDEWRAGLEGQSASLAHRRAAAPLKPPAPQQFDLGALPLFGDHARQQELF